MEVIDSYFSLFFAKQLLKMFEISTWFVTVETLEDKHFGKSQDVFLTVIKDFFLFQLFSILVIEAPPSGWRDGINAVLCFCFVLLSPNAAIRMCCLKCTLLYKQLI